MFRCLVRDIYIQKKTKELKNDQGYIEVTC